jgi:hypothetical protein
MPQCHRGVNSTRGIEKVKIGSMAARRETLINVDTGDRHERLLATKLVQYYPNGRRTRSAMVVGRSTRC